MKARFIGENIGNGFETFVTPGDVGIGAEHYAALQAILRDAGADE